MQENKERFKRIYSSTALRHGIRVWVDTETGVEYAQYDGEYTSGLTLLVNSDGTPKINEEWKNNNL